MGLRELLILLLGFAIVAVILRGLYVAMQARRGQIKLAIDKNIPQDVDLEALELAELPGGGARVVSRSPAEEAAAQSALDLAKERAAAMDLGEDDSAVPVLMDSVAVAADADYDSTTEDASRYDVDETDGISASAENDVPADYEDPDQYDDPDDVLLDYGEETATDPLASVQPDYPQDDEDYAARAEEEQGELPLAESDYESSADDVLEPAIGSSQESSQADSDHYHEDFAEEEYASEDSHSGAADADAEDYYPDDEAGQSPSDTANEDAYYADDAREAGNEVFDEDAERVEPAFNPDAVLDDDANEFTMTAGERIGYQEEESKPSRSLFTRFAKNSAADPAADEDMGEAAADNTEDSVDAAPRKSLFSALRRKTEESLERFKSDQNADADDEYESTRQDDSDLPADSLAEQTDLYESEYEAESEVEDDFDNEDYAAEESEQPNLRVAEAQPASSSGQPTAIKQQSVASQPSEVIVLNVMARDGYAFRGEDLLQELIGSGLKFGEMAIFHQHYANDSKGPVIYSVANVLNPGTFDLNDMSNFNTVGISMFLALPSPINNLEAFEMMLDTAQRLRATLDGELKDDHRNVMTAQTIEHYRQRIRDFELRQLKAAGSRG